MSGGQAANTKTTNKPARRPGARRRFLTWTLLSAAALVVVLWVVSVWWVIEVPIGKLIVNLRGGYCWVHWDEFGVESSAPTARRETSSVAWWWAPSPAGRVRGFNGGALLVERVYFSRGDYITHVVMLLWPIALLTTLSGAGLLISARRARRRALTHHCPACGYDLIGLPPNAPCPECGPKVK